MRRDTPLPTTDSLIVVRIVYDSVCECVCVCMVTHPVCVALDWFYDARDFTVIWRKRRK